MGKKIFAVNSGVYSDYRVVALFSTQEKAQAFMNAAPNQEYNDIEVYELDPPAADLLRRGYSVWYILMRHDGTTERVERTENDHYDVVEAPRYFVWERTKFAVFAWANTPDVLVSKVWAKTEMQAVKIVNERRVQMIANGEWKWNSYRMKRRSE